MYFHTIPVPVQWEKHYKWNVFNALNTELNKKEQALHFSRQRKIQWTETETAMRLTGGTLRKILWAYLQYSIPNHNSHTHTRSQKHVFAN